MGKGARDIGVKSHIITSAVILDRTASDLAQLPKYIGAQLSDRRISNSGLGFSVIVFFYGIAPNRRAALCGPAIQR
jgi:hypothetical protein